MLGFLKAVVPFLPNLIGSYQRKAPAASSELYVAVAAVLGQVLHTFNIVSLDNWNQYFAGAVVYVLGRLLSKSLGTPPVDPSAN